MELNDASRIIDVIDQRIRRLTQSESRVETTWGTVAALDATGRYADLYLYGQSSPYASAYFRLPNGLSVNVGDSVKAAIDKERDDRWVEEVHAFSSYNKVEFDVVNGVVRFGSGAAAADVNLYRDSANVLRTDDSMFASDFHANFGAWLDRNGTGAPLLFSSTADVRLYRASAGTLNIDSNGSAVDTVIGSRGTSGHRAGVAADIAGDTLRRAVLWGDATMQGIEFGPGNAARDVNLYRSAANVLKTDDTFIAPVGKFGGTSGPAVYIGDDGLISDVNIADAIGISGQQTPANGILVFGSNKDTNLYRSAANQLKTDDALDVASPLGIGATPYDISVSGNGLGFLNGGAALITKHKGILVSTSYASPDPPAEGIQFGADVNLYRSAANVLRTDDSFTAAANLTVLGQLSGATGVLPYAIWVGSVSVSLSAAAAGFTTVSFPAGRFTVAPYVFVTQESLPGGSGKFIAKVNSNVTTTSADIYVYTGDGTTVTATAAIRVLAIQMTSGAADG